MIVSPLKGLVFSFEARVPMAYAMGQLFVTPLRG
jgi:hypothetical protein